MCHPLWTRGRSASLAILLVCCTGTVASQDKFTACLDSCRVAVDVGDHQRAMRLLKEAQELALDKGDSAGLAQVMVQRSEVLIARGDYNASLDELFHAQALYEGLGDDKGLATVFNNIGSIYRYDHDPSKARDYYSRSLAIRERSGTPHERAQLYNNFGDLMEELGLPDSALLFHRRQLRIRVAEKDSSWLAITYSHIGSCHDMLGNTDSALHYMQLAVALLQDPSMVHQRIHLQTKLGRVHLSAGNIEKALHWCGMALERAKALAALPRLEECYKCLYEAHERAGHDRKALQMLKSYMVTRDSMFGQERAKDLMRIELSHTFKRQRFADSLATLEEQRRADMAYEAGLAREREQKRLFLYSGIGLLLLAGGLWNRLRFVRRSRNIIQLERERSDRLLLNILPKPIAEELKLHGRAQAREVDGVSILFTDFHAFTQLSEQLSAPDLVGEIDACYKAFDAICQRHGLEKIKTIGDAYMAAGGLPEPQPESAMRTVLAALEMQAWLAERARQRQAEGQPAFTMRAGIHTGPVVAGIVGDTKFQYDVWGDTVNTAARMESSGAVGQVNISESTRALLKDAPGFTFTPRGRIQAKGKGELEMFFAQRNSDGAG